MNHPSCNHITFASRSSIFDVKQSYLRSETAGEVELYE